MLQLQCQHGFRSHGGIRKESELMYCKDCSKPANRKLTIRDAYERVHDVWLCDMHADKFLSERIVDDVSRKEYMERRYE